MRKFQGRVRSGKGIAARYLTPIQGLLKERTGLPTLAEGTLNVDIDEPYKVRGDIVIEKEEYIPYKMESLKLQRCRIQGVRGMSYN